MAEIADDIFSDAAHAAVELIGRSGARKLEIGFLHENVPMEEAGWYAHAQYRGARITAEDHTSPAAALEALARRILTGGRCTHCGGLVALTDRGALAYATSTLADGTPWNVEQAREAGQCRWRRAGRTWKRGCE
ncbi:hypothetical protein AB0O28_18990 [Microbispora sp. NPDC088329]|uniref:hypothetical protein n=1 Tax=Microbispora sp. NPDC088329 TaxID=3154869 RepID=UPI00344743B5